MCTARRRKSSFSIICMRIVFRIVRWDAPFSARWTTLSASRAKICSSISIRIIPRIIWWWWRLDVSRIMTRLWRKSRRSFPGSNRAISVNLRRMCRISEVASTTNVGTTWSMYTWRWRMRRVHGTMPTRIRSCLCSRCWDNGTRSLPADNTARLVSSAIAMRMRHAQWRRILWRLIHRTRIWACLACTPVCIRTILSFSWRRHDVK
mmetsp:Transcript_13935/g.21008  ORF Transcript_13935/g.21008 Transcript_13935/m.21008 type:complete len:206 (+) Transcript_13935:724-1341(+)